VLVGGTYAITTTTFELLSGAGDTELRQIIPGSLDAKVCHSSKVQRDHARRPEDYACMFPICSLIDNCL
jgi:hypothetical protein